MIDTRVEELEAWAEAEGIDLPLPADEIIALEDEGFVVDLETGQILEDVDPDAPVDLQPNTPSNAGDWN